MSMQSIARGNFVIRTPVLGFGCSAVMGRVGRKASLAALAAAYDAGVIFYDTARSYGYGESEGLLGEFLRGRRDQVLLSTKFGIRPAAASPLKRVLKPVARMLLQVVPGARKTMQGQLASMSSAGHFSVDALHQSLHESLRALRTDYVDFLFLHEAPASVLQQDDLFTALRKLVDAGKIRRFGIASQPEVIEAAITGRVLGLQAVQFPCNLFNMSLAEKWQRAAGDVLAVANHPFGGAAGIAASKALLSQLASAPGTPATLREKLLPMDGAVLADFVLNAITRDTGMHVVVPSMLRLDHLRANVAAMEHSRFSSEEIRWLRGAITGSTADRGLEY
ncbi:aldo/keto reductase [Granulicella sp. L46]|uniref:aldo/keto reductase n=1 Tax=Granulicella sp. L46 TaxID=1641865 RepID=UPI00131BDED6|nr:aldo/keto reductase [Granulicella sp. L46]